MTGRVTLNIEDGIGQILLDRADKMNAITPEMTQELQSVCRAVDVNRDIRVVTIGGAGERAFSAGSDLNTLVNLSDVMAFRDRIEYAALVRDIKKPVIAGLKGWVLGGVMEIAKRIASFSPTATQAIKAAVRVAISTPLEAGLRYENELHVICMSDKGRLEGI